MRKASWPGGARSQQRWGARCSFSTLVQPGIPCLSPTSCLSPAVPTHIAPWEGLGSLTAETVCSESFVSPSCLARGSSLFCLSKKDLLDSVFHAISTLLRGMSAWDLLTQRQFSTGAQNPGTTALP